MRPKVCIIGAGAIGSLFAGHLAQVADVSILTRRQSHADALNRDGLRLSGRADIHSQVVATADPDGLPAFEIGIIATKATGLEEAARSIAGRFPDATIVTTLNGLGAEEVVRGYGSWPLVSGVTFMSGTRHSDTHVEYVLDTETWLGPYEHTPYERVVEIGALIASTGLKVEVLPDLRPAQWSKLIFNSVVNSIGAVTNLPHVREFARTDRSSDLGTLVRAMMNEGKAVAAAQGIKLYEDPWEMNVRAVSHGQTGDEDYAHVFSMLSDVRALQPTEIDWLTGAIVREARRVGVPVPIHELLFALVKGIEHGWST